MARVTVPVAMLEFEENGNTIWVHSPVGSTVLRIKTMGKIIVDDKCQNVVAHSDVIVEHDVVICLPPKPKRVRSKGKKK